MNTWMSHRHRTTEGILLVFAAIVLLLGFVLAFLGRMPALDDRGTVNINAASPDELASVLNVDRGAAKRICDYRDQHGPFVNTASLSRVRLLTSAEAGRLYALSSGGADLSALSAIDLSIRADIGHGAASRILEAVLIRGDRPITRSWLERLPVVSASKVAALDSRIRARDPGATVVSYWVHAGLLILSFFLMHLLLRKRASGADPYLLPSVMILCGLAAIVLFSIKDPLRDTFVFPQQVRGILLGALAFAVPLTARFRAFRAWRYTYIYALSAIALVLTLLLFGRGPAGTRISFLGFQPMEIVKIALVFFVASYLSDRWHILLDRTGPRRRIEMPLFRDIGPLIVMYLLSLLTFVLVRDLGPMLILFGMFVAMLYVATGKPSFIGVGLAVIGVTGAIAHVLKLGVFDVRVDMWLHPWDNIHENGMQLAQGFWGLATGGIWGSGLGLGSAHYMPRGGSDLMPAALGEEIGLVGLIVVLALYSLIIVRGLRIALHARTDFDRFLGAGLSTLFGIQTVTIVFGVLGLTPLTGVTLPFASYGKSSLIASFFILGMLLNISADGRHGVDVRTETRRAFRRLGVGFAVLLLGVAGIGRLVWIQGIAADRIAGRTITAPDADGVVRAHVNPRLRSIEASIPRGSIYDRNGKPLASSRASELGDLAENAAGRPGKRYYPFGGDSVHLVGYLDPICGGPVGMEKWHNGDLRGFDDYSELLPMYRLRRTPFQPHRVGKDLRLTIDAELQDAVEKALSKYAGAVRDRRTGRPKTKGAAVVLDVYTGEVLAAVSIPHFDPNELTRGIWKSYNGDESGEAVLVNRALHGLYPPGSTFKLVTAASALENGVDVTYVCRHSERNVSWRAGGRTWSRRRITDLEEMGAHGSTDLSKAVRVSCNVYFAHLGLELGEDRLYETAAKKFRLEHIPPPKGLRPDLPDNAYGQGRILVTPLEMARVVAAIANGGIMMKPQFVKDIRLGDEVQEESAPVEMGRPISPATSRALRKMMADVTTIGTARGTFAGLRVSVAGKTGSAENDQADRMPHSWFVGFAPVEDPRIAFAVVVENGGWGRNAAGPVCREIVKAAL